MLGTLVVAMQNMLGVGKYVVPRIHNVFRDRILRELLPYFRLLAKCEDKSKFKIKKMVCR